MKTAVLVLIEVLVVIGLSRLLGIGCRWLKQPLVIGEIIAGILLGPSCLGLLFPDLASLLFPPQAVPFLEVLSQLGLIFFMFLIGLELDPKYLKGQLNVAVLISSTSILVPFSLAALLALVLYPLVSDADVSFTAFTLFIGSSLSITAFPVLARIITENNLQSTRLGTLALTCAAVDDLTAWCLLALAIAVTRTNSMMGAIPTILEALIFVGLMLTVGRLFLRRLAKYYDRSGHLTQTMLALIYMGVLVAALITETIGIHLIFGAFLLGAILPKHVGLTRELAQKTEDFVLTVLLPVFFAYSGLRTQIGLLNRPELWLLTVLVFAVAVIGKYAGTYGAARISGLQHREASALGWLMNTRGLTELIVLNIGLSLNVISPLLFTMLVIMALTTTFMTSPLLEWCYPKQQIRQDKLPDLTVAEPDYRILLPVANPSTQRELLQMALAIAGIGSASTTIQSGAIYLLSLIEMEENYAFASTPREASRLIAQQRSRLETLLEPLEPLDHHRFIHTIVEITNDVARETARIADIDHMNLVIVGWHRPAFRSNRLGGRVGKILSTARADVAVYVATRQEGWNQQLGASIEKILVPYASNSHNDLALELALRLLMNFEEAQLRILRITQENSDTREFSYELRAIIEQLPQSVRDRISQSVIIPGNTIQAVVEASKEVDLTIAGASREWGLERQTLGRYADALANQCRSSLLITRRYNRSTSHLDSVLTESLEQEQLNSSESGVKE
jgi:Kef-type K+ transport system membrane component KefB/nucleotide-binding universal stress UspA family protein